MILAAEPTLAPNAQGDGGCPPWALAFVAHLALGAMPHDPAAAAPPIIPAEWR